MQSSRSYGVGRSWRWLLVFRSLLIAGSLAVAGLLISRHQYPLGILIGVLALVRGVYLFMRARRRGALGVRWNRGGAAGNTSETQASSSNGSTGGARGVLREMARPEFVVAGGVIGLNADQMRQAFDQGQSIAELAKGVGVPLDRVVAAIVADASGVIDRKVAEGTMAQRQARLIKQRIPTWASRLVNFHKGDVQRSRMSR